MIQIAREFRTSRKNRICDYCGGSIEIGDRYCHQVNKETGECWAFNAHCECEFLATELYDFIDPWDGMTEDDFYDGVHEFCYRMICPNCASWDDEYGECRQDQSYCTHKCIEKLLKYDFTTVKCDLPQAKGKRCWGFVEKKNPLEKVPGTT